MIANITPGSSFQGLINYHEEKIYAQKASFLGANNVPSENPVIWVNSLESTSIYNKKCVNPTFHVSINLPPGESVSDTKFMEIGKDYMEGMGYKDQPYVVFRHKDREHEHIHIASSRIDQNKKKIDDSFEHRRSVRVTENLEKKHGLTLVDRSKKEQSLFISDVNKIKGDYGKIKNQIANIIDYTLKEYSLTDINEFKKVLELNQVGVKKISGVAKNKQWEGLVFYLLDKEGNRATQTIPASKIHFKPTIKRLEKYFEKSKPTKEKEKKQVAARLSKLLNKYQYISPEELKAQLEKDKIKVIFSENKGGIYGVSFFDQRKGVFYKGSELGKAFSWNSLKDKLDTDLSVTTREFKRMIIGSYRDILKKHQKEGKSFFESQFLTRNTSEELKQFILLKQDSAILENPIFKNKLESGISDYIKTKYEEFDTIREKEVKFAKYSVKIGIHKMAEFVNHDEITGYRILESLNLRLVLDSDYPQLYHHADKSLNYTKTISQLNSLGIYNFDDKFIQSNKFNPLKRKVLRTFAVNKQVPPILFFEKPDTIDFLNEKGKLVFNTLQNKQYIHYKQSLLSKKKLTPENQMLSLLFRGIVPDLDKEGNLIGRFHHLTDKKNIVCPLSKEITKGCDLEDLKVISNKIQQTPYLDKRLKLNNAIDQKNLFTIRSLSSQGVKPLLPSYELEELDLDIQEALTEGASSYHAVSFANLTADIVTGMVGILGFAGGGGGSVDDNAKKKKKKRKKNYKIRH